MRRTVIQTNPDTIAIITPISTAIAGPASRQASRRPKITPTGVVTSELVRLSEVPKWSPIEIFDEARHYRVEESNGNSAVAQR